MAKRTQWIDSCRFFAIFVIMCTHFLAEFRPAALQLWEQGLSSWLLYGLTGKFSVAFFFVLLGYFASKAAYFSPSGFLRYALRRYVHFAFFVFTVGLVYILGCYGCTWLFHSPGEAALRVISDGFRLNISYLVRDALLFENSYNDTLWCMQQLFLASIICRALGYLPKRMGAAAAVFVMAVLMLIDAAYCIWICAGILGFVLRLVRDELERRKLPVKPSVIIVALLLALLLIKLRMAEGVLQYALQAAAAWLLIFAQFYLPPVQRLLAARPFPRLGGISMGLFVVHTPINALLASSAYPLLTRLMPEGAAQLLCFALSLTLSIVCAELLHRIYSAIEKKLKKA